MTNTEDEDTLADALTTVASGGALVLGGKIVAVGLGFLTQFVMARWLLTDAYGSVILTLTVMNVAVMLAQFGLDDGVMRKVPEHEDSPAEVRGVVRAGFRIAAFTGVVIAIGLLAFAPMIASQVFNDSSLTSLLRIAAVGIPFTVMGQVAVSAARGVRSARPHLYANHLLQPSARLVLITVLVVTGLGAVGAVLGKIVAMMLSSVFAFGFAYRVLPSWDGVPPVQMNRSILVFSLPLIAMQGTNFLISNADTFMIGYYLQSDQVGIYNIAFQLRNGLVILLVASGFLLPPVLTRLQVNENYDELRTIYRSVTRWVLFVTLPVFLVLFTFPSLILSMLFGEAYAAGATALRILAIGGFASAAMGANTMSLIGLGANRKVMYITVLSALVNVVLNVALIPLFGVLGAAVASTTATVLQNVANVAILYRNFGVIPLSIVEVRPTVVALVAGGIGYFFVRTTGIPVQVVVLLWITLYPTIVIRFNGVTTEDKRFFADVERSLGIEFVHVRRYYKYNE